MNCIKGLCIRKVQNHCVRGYRFKIPWSWNQAVYGFTFLHRNRSEKEVRAAALVLQTIWGYKELRKPLEKEGWKKSDFQVQYS